MEVDDEFGTDFEYTQDLEQALQSAESHPLTLPGARPSRELDGTPIVDVEDVIQSALSPFHEFRKRGWLSVSDLVGTIWCELQYDYRLRTLPYLPVSQRPKVIKSVQGNDISVDSVKVKGKERILKRGDKIHKRLEKELHPEQIIVRATTREDAWGLKLLNMICGLESLITLGKCREMPVVGFVDGIFVMGIIDELSRIPVDPKAGTTQRSILSFFSSPHRARSHKVLLSDSKTRASGTLPRESDSRAGQLQCMLYKELLDAMLLPPDGSTSILPTGQSFSFAKVFAHLDLDPKAVFTDSFIAESRPVIEGNELRYGAEDARCLEEFVKVWYSYVSALGLGLRHANADGSTENSLQLVYRRASRTKQKSGDMTETSSQESNDEEKQVLAIAPSVHGNQVVPPSPSSLSEEDQVDEELLLAIEMSVAEREPEEQTVALPASQNTPGSPQKSKPHSKSQSVSGSIIGRHSFQHNPKDLANHLESVLQFWLGKREPVGVDIVNTNRCGWCEFEEGCEWRQKKAEEALAKFRAQRP